MEVSPDDAILIQSGFRVERKKGEHTVFVTPHPCTRRLSKKARVASWLNDEHRDGRLMHIKKEIFVFGKRKRSAESAEVSGGNTEASSGDNEASFEETQVFGGDTEASHEDTEAFGGDTEASRGDTEASREETEASAGENTASSGVLFMVQQLSRDPLVILNHGRLLSNTASMVDSLLTMPSPPLGQEDFQLLKKKLAATNDIDSVLKVLFGDQDVRKLLCGEFSNIVIAEIADIDSRKGPLSDFPPNINSNVFCDVVKYGMERCPHTLALLADVAVRSRSSVMPKDVLNVATMFANICYLGNHDLDSLVKMRSLMLKTSGTTDLAMDILSDTGLAQTSRALNSLKDSHILQSSI